MVGSVLMERMRAERDFDLVEPLFFTTSQVGGRAPDIGRDVPPLKDAKDIAALKAMDVLLSCQGGDYTSEIFPKLRAAGWKGHWIDAASALRMADHAVIVLDPVNRPVIDKALAAGGRDNGPPGIRAHYHPDYYGAFVLDPDGHNVEAVCHKPEA